MVLENLLLLKSCPLPASLFGAPCADAAQSRLLPPVGNKRNFPLPTARRLAWVVIGAWESVLERSGFSVGAAPRGRPAVYGSGVRHTPAHSRQVGQGLPLPRCFLSASGGLSRKALLRFRLRASDFLRRQKVTKDRFKDPWSLKISFPSNPAPCLSLFSALRKPTRLNPARCRPWAGEGPSAPNGEAPCGGGHWGVGMLAGTFPDLPWGRPRRPRADVIRPPRKTHQRPVSENS